jgi:hypothetical protein
MGAGQLLLVLVYVVASTVAFVVSGNHEVAVHDHGYTY